MLAPTHFVSEIAHVLICKVVGLLLGIRTLIRYGDGTYSFVLYCVSKRGMYIFYLFKFTHYLIRTFLKI